MLAKKVFSFFRIFLALFFHLSKIKPEQ